MASVARDAASTGWNGLMGGGDSDTDSEGSTATSPTRRNEAIGTDDDDFVLEVEGAQVRRAAPEPAAAPRVPPPSAPAAAADDAWDELESQLKSLSSRYQTMPQAAPPSSAPEGGQQAPTIFEGSGFEQVGSAKAASEEPDDEFDYVFEGGQREGATHKQVGARSCSEEAGGLSTARQRAVRLPPVLPEAPRLSWRRTRVIPRCTPMLNRRLRLRRVCSPTRRRSSPRHCRNTW